MDKFIETYSGKILPICARPGMGTTALALQIADAYTQNTDKAAVIFSPRLTKVEILDRIVCQRLPFDYYGKVKKNDLSEDLQKQFAFEKEKVAESKLQIVEATEMTDDKIKQILAYSNNVRASYFVRNQLYFYCVYCITSAKTPYFIRLNKAYTSTSNYPQSSR